MIRLLKKAFPALSALLIAAAVPSAQTPAAPPTPPPAKGEASPARAGRATASAPVNLNTATAADLQTLPGVGPATATRILEYRQKNGGFRKIEDLMNVKGIGEKSFLKLKPLVMVAAPKLS